MGFKKTFLACSCMAYSLSACTSFQTEKTFTAVSDTPVISTNSLSKKFTCYQDKLKDNYLFPNNKGVSLGFYVKNIADGTVPEGMDSPLSDAGKLQMLSSLGKLFHSHKQIMVSYHFPRNLANPAPTSDISESDGVNGQGFLSKEAFRAIKASQAYFINQRRKGSPLFKDHLAEENQVTFYIIDGAFSRNDSDDGAISDGLGVSGEYEKKKKTAEIEWGTKYGKKFLSLTILLAEPLSNTVDYTETFELSIKKNAKTAELKVGRSGISAGVAIEKEQVESLHNAQQVLIDYASLWIVDQFLLKEKSFLPLELKKC